MKCTEIIYIQISRFIFFNHGCSCKIIVGCCLLNTAAQHIFNSSRYLASIILLSHIHILSIYFLIIMSIAYIGCSSCVLRIENFCPKAYVQNAFQTHLLIHPRSDIFFMSAIYHTTSGYIYSLIRAQTSLLGVLVLFDCRSRRSGVVP